ncbi:hypothetical protein [Teichococcus aestuarii]|uniref:hypothetical protein n=1 Tax=Teichococcus aestuarii TaxID=568898 RepID=UPI00362275C0
MALPSVLLVLLFASLGPGNFVFIYLGRRATSGSSISASPARSPPSSCGGRMSRRRG